MSLRAVIVDDSVEFLRTARCLLEREGIVVVAGVSTGSEAVRAAEVHHPDVVLVDIRLGQESGFDIAVRLSGTKWRHGRTIIISDLPEQDFAGLVEAGPAIGFVSKSRLSARAIIELLDSSDRDPGLG